MAPITVAKGRTPASNSTSTLSSEPPQHQQQPYTQMSDSDLESIGRHCQFEYCHQLDFLPFRCESCRGTFCLEHRTETAHKCPRAGEWARRRNNNNNNNISTATTTITTGSTQKPTIYNSEQCAHLSCRTLINTLTDPAVRCPDCGRLYCLRHRLREEHECVKVLPLGARVGNRVQQQQGLGGGNATETLKSMFAKVRTWGKDKTQSSTGSKTTTATTPASRFASLNALKRSAKGDTSIPTERRLYLHVVGSSDTEKSEPPSGDFFFDSRWKVGRVLDDAARRLRVENLNNRGGGEEARLRVFHVEAGEFLEFSESIGEGKVKQGHTIVLLRGAGVLLGKS